MTNDSRNLRLIHGNINFSPYNDAKYEYKTVKSQRWHMLSLKKRIAVCVVLALMFVATVFPAAAQDSSTPPPSSDTSVVTLQITKTGGIVVTLSLPVRCGNDC